MPNEIIREMNVENVIRQTMKLFAEHGVEPTTINMIGAAAHVSGRSVLNYFGTKEQLIRTVLERLTTECYGRFEEFVTTGEFRRRNGLEQAVGICAYAMEQAREQHRYVNCMLEMEIILSRQGLYPVEEYYAPMRGNTVTRRLADAVQKGLDDGSIRKDLPGGALYARIISGALRGVFQRMAFLLRDEKLTEKYQPARIVDDYIDLIRRTLATVKA